MFFVLCSSYTCMTVPLFPKRTLPNFTLTSRNAEVSGANMEDPCQDLHNSVQWFWRGKGPEPALAPV